MGNMKSEGIKSRYRAVLSAEKIYKLNTIYKFKIEFTELCLLTPFFILTPYPPHKYMKVHLCNIYVRFKPCSNNYIVVSMLNILLFCDSSMTQINVIGI